MSVSDTAVGAILEIPAELLRDIQKAQRYIDNLQITSKRAADEVAKHWGTVATGGLDSFIQKLSDAQNAMKGLGTINVTLNTNAAVQSTEQLSTATQKTSSDVSKAVQDMAQSWSDFAEKNSRQGLNLFSEDLNSVDKLKAALESLRQKRDALIEDERGGAGFQKGGFFNRQELTDQIDALEKIIKLLRQSTTQREEANKKIADKNDKIYLDEQKRLLADILDLRKQVNGQKIVVAQGQVTGSSTLEQDKKILSDLIARLYEAKDKLKEYNAEKYKNVSAEGQAKAQVNTLNQENALIKEQMAFRDKLNTAIARGNELTAQTQASKARLGNTDEAIAQRQLNSDYKEMLKVIKEKGEIQAKAAEQGRSLNQQEIALISALDARYKLFESDIQRVASSYTKMSEAAERQFANDKNEQLARNAVVLADAQKKAADAAQKVADAQAKTAQQKADKDRSHAESELNKLYTERLRLLKEKEQLENKALINTAKGLPDLTAKENQLLAEVTAKIATIDGQIKNIGNTYRGLALKAQHAFALDELRQATSLQNQFNKALDAVDTSKTKKLVEEYKRLYAENERIQKSLDAANKLPAGSMTPQAYQIYNNLFAEQGANIARMVQIEKQNIQEVADFRRQKDIEYSQQSLSAFAQAEAQKTAESKKQAEQQSNDRLQAYQKFLNSYQGAMAAANRLGTRGGQWEDTYENRERVIKNLEAAIRNLKKTDADYERKLKDLTDALNKLKSAQDAVKNAMKPVVSPQDAINMAKNASTLRELEAAYKALKEAMANTKSSDPQWTAMNTQLQKTKTNIDEIKKKMDEFQSQASKTSGVVNQLQGRIAAAFSIGAINGFIKKMVETRAQFELQRVALGAILQDKDKADKTFLEVQQMALQSPFTIMQLERATKQIAAFGFEADKLKPTLKMLADMSAGLGVEIDRLVLVMGHLKARNYLEGTMVRQFTNAGFNVLGELAKYYTELEGRMVSVAEVQSRVKKKMVEFGDVEEVLKRVTSAGGMFYDMQKKQSESLYGQMQRISDAYDLMLNEIGKDNQNMIAKALTLIRTLISHWRMLAPTLKEIGYLMAGVFAVKGAVAMLYQLNKLGIIVQTLGKSWRLVGVAAGRAATSMKLAWASSGIGILIAGILTAITVFQGLNAEAKALNEEMDRIGGESVKNLNESITQFKRLADVMSDGNKTYVERKDAMKELKRIYADILPQEKMEIGYIESLKGNYTELMDIISEYYRAKEYQHKYEAVINSQQAKDVQEEIERTFKRMNEDQALGLIFSDAQIKAWSEKLANELNTGKLANSLEAMHKRVTEIFPDASDIGIWDYFYESYGKADFSDVQDKVEKVRQAFGDISLSTTEATNALAMYNAQIGHMDFGQLDSEQEKIVIRLRQIKTSLDNINNLPQTSDQSVIEQRQKMIAQLTTEYENYVHALDSIAEARGKVLAKEFYDEIESETKEIQKVYQEYWRLGVRMRDLKTQGKELTPEFEKLKKEQEACGKSADELAKKFNLGDDMSVSKGFLDATETSYELSEKMKLVAQKAFPILAQKAQENIDNFQIAILKGEKTWWSFLGSLKSILPEGWTKEWGDIAAKIGATEAEIATLSSEAGPASNKVDVLAESMGKLYSDISKDVAKKYGANFERLNTIMSDSSKVAKDMSTELRNEAKTLNETTKAYDAAKKKGQEYVDSFLKGQQKTAEEIEQMKKDAQAFSEAADRLWIDEKKTKGAKGKDPELELWKNRLKALQDYYTAREKARKNLSESETRPQQRMSFEKLWQELGFDSLKGLSLNDLIAQGFDPKKLQTNLVSSLEQLKNLIPDKYADVKKDIERTIAKEKIEIEFKIKEGEREQLQKSITEMFDNYALTKELSNLGVSVDLTYMVGGKPTTLSDIRREIYRLRSEGGDKADAENRIKILEEAEKKMIQIEEKNQRQRMKNYIKYLTESMAERAQIEIKALQDVNKIREDATLDQFSKEQAIMQRRKKMNEDLSKMDLDSLKSSDVYISVFKDLERASKEQLQYVLNKLKELQSTFKDLSPAQVKSIASEMKKIEDALADKDSIKRLGTSLLDTIRYARQRNDLLKEQAILQTKIGDSDKALQSAQAELYQFELNRASIQDQNTEEWKEANEAVQRQRMYVFGLQSQISVLQDQLKAITNEIDNGESAWKRFQSGLSKVQKGINQAKESLDAVFSGLDSMGLVNDAFRDTYESIGEILGGVDTFMSGLGSMDITKPFSIITGGVKAIGGIFQSIGGIFNIGDKKKERQIKRLAEKVEDLDKAYQKLEKSIEAAYTFDDYNAGYKQMQANLEDQKAKYEEMIALEEAKKKTDKEKVKEYKEKLEEIAEAEEELRKERIEAMGSTTDYLSEAQSFVDAWLKAYKETGNGLDALSESWEEFIEGLFVKQAAAQIVSAKLKSVIDDINKAIEDGKTDFDLADAVNKAREDWKKVAKVIEPLLEQLFGSYGLGKGNGDFILSDLQKGIQNITEPQAAAIEAYLNSMRFAVFRHTEQLDTLIMTIQAQYGSGAENPVVTELKGIRGVLDNIYSTLRSVVKTQTGKTGIVIVG